MRVLKLPIARLHVRRTGLAFYDAARVIGVAQLFFGTSGANVQETATGWDLRGVADLTQADPRRLWIRERLKRFERKPNNYARLEMWGRSLAAGAPGSAAKWQEIRAYFTDPFAPHNLANENTTSLMDAALALGARGSDPSKYADFAAESGTPSQEPEAETLVALIGLSHAARVNNALYLLPFFGNPPGETVAKPYPLTTARYWSYNRYFAHQGGEHIAATWAMLSMLENLFDVGLPVQDFVYNRADRPIYHSGTLGAERLCKHWRSGCDDVLREIGRFLQATQSEKGGHAADLARALADFALNPDVEGLERVVRLKARAMADEDNRASSLLRQPTAIKEIKTMMNGNVPDLPECLCRTVWRALDMANKGWIGRYMKLENANTPHRFFEEIERLISHAKMDREVYYGPEATGPTVPQLINQLAGSPRLFRAFRAAFLLKVLQIPIRPDSTSEAIAESTTVGPATTIEDNKEVGE